MTLGEAIKHAEEVAGACEYDASKWDMTDAYEQSVACGLGKCAEEHRQLAEWLKELKAYKEQSEDAISRQAVKDTIFAECSSINLDIDFAKVLLLQRAIKALPSVTPQPKTGHWFVDERPESDREIICSNCEQPIFKYHKMDFDYRPNYCPNCGCPMEIER